MDQQFRRRVIDALLRDEPLPLDWAHALFPPAKREVELVYYGKEREEEILADAMSVPLQEVSTFGRTGGDWENKLIFGDNLQAMKTLLQMKESGQLRNADGTSGVKLIYIDPPFATRREFRGNNDEKAYQDKLVGAQFVEFLRKRLILMRELLAPNGSIYVHLDEKKSHYAKVILDEVFGENNFQREIVWRIGWLSGYKTRASNWIRNHDVIFYYTKSSAFTFNKSYIPYPADYRRRDGSAPEGKGYPLEDTWNCSDLDRLDSIQIMSFANEKTGFPTQKNENLLRRIISTSSNPGDIVLDAFAGSGTTLAVAEKLKRRWIGIDCGKLSIYTIQKRLLHLRGNIGSGGQAITPTSFTIYNAGLYDFATLRKLPWHDWRFFALQLFGCKDEPHEIGGLPLDGKLKGSSVLVFKHDELAGKRIDEETVRDIHLAIGAQIGKRFFIIAPRGSFDFQQDYLDFDGARYYALRIPYSFINELHTRSFTALEQPRDESAINATVDAVGFDFIRPPRVGWIASSRKVKAASHERDAVLRIRSFASTSRVRGGDREGGLETFAMLMLDLNYDGNVFDFDKFYLAADLQRASWEVTIPGASIGKQVMAVFIDIFGNESRELIPREKFGLLSAGPAPVVRRRHQHAA